MPASDLQKRLGVSQPTLWRAMAALQATGEVIRLGSTRRQIFTMPRPSYSMEMPVSVMKVDEAGNLSPFGSLVALPGGRFWMDEVDGPTARHDGLPWFLSDMRPQGFVGRAQAQAISLENPQLGLPVSLGHWTDDHVLRALCHAGDDLPGNLILGEGSLRRYHQRADLGLSAQSTAEYPVIAQQVMTGSVPGSSAGGEQPKFCVFRDGAHRIVKFSPAGTSETDQRWRDLLVCEHLAAMTLADAGVPACRSTAHIEGGRVFLDIERFDRTRHGRLGMVSLLAYDREFIGQIDNWAATSGRMFNRGLMTQADARNLRLLEAFGRFIANSDRHYGNVSLIRQTGEGRCGRWRLAPVYDMLPMLYAPVAGELVERAYDLSALNPLPATLDVWGEAASLAGEFWGRVASDNRISDAFRTEAQRHRHAIQSGAAETPEEPPADSSAP